MTLLGQSQPEAQRPIGSIVAPKRQTNIGCWNVRTLAETTRAGQVAKEMKEYGIEVLGISETRWKGTGTVTLQSGEKMVYVGTTGRSSHHDECEGKGSLDGLDTNYQKDHHSTIYSKYKKLTVVQAFAPTNDAMDEKKG